MTQALSPLPTDNKKTVLYLNEYLNEPMSLEIDLDNDALLSVESKTQFKEGQYMLPTEASPQEALARGCIAYASDLGHAERLYSYVSKLWFMFASPVLASAANPRGCPISCFLSDVEDDRASIAAAWEEILWLSTEGGGVGMNWSKVRSVGECTSRGTYTPGLIPFLKAVDSITLASIQGGVRRGATAVYLDISHPEIIEFLESRRTSGGDTNRKLMNLFNAINIPDAFMKAVQEGTHWDLIDPHSKQVKDKVLARDLWRRILEVRMETGRPYLHFTDTSNRALPQWLKDKGLKINGSNLCVAPETRILTRNGYVEIADLEGHTIDVWNGLEWSPAQVAKTGENKELIQVLLSDGTTIDCTPEHIFYTQNTYSSAPKQVKAIDLIQGDKLEKFDLPIDVTSGTVNLAHAYDYGFYCGDGNKGYDVSWIYTPKQEVISRLTKGTVSDSPDEHNRFRWVHGKFALDDFTVPPQYFTVQSRLEFLAGYLDADGCVTRSNNCDNIQVGSVNYDFLKELSLMLQEMGVHSSLAFRREAGEYMLPLNDGSGENGLFNCKEVWLLTINGVGVKRLVDLGIVFNRLKLSKTQDPQRAASRFVTVVAVKKTRRISDTYCFTEKKRHRGMFNGILTGQCNEIFLPTNDERTAVCCLSSVNLEYFDEWRDNPLFIPDLIEMLDNVLSVFINKAPKHLTKAINSAKLERSIGLGTMGFHLYLQSKNIPFESAIADGQNRRIFKHIKDQATETTQRLAVEKGEAPDAVGFGVRNSHLLAIAPNASSAVLCNNTSPSIEPYNANVFVQKTGNGPYVIYNRALEKLFVEKYKLSKDERRAVWDDILANEGSVQHLGWMDAHDRDVFKTSFELDQRWIIEHAANRQPFICQGQSVNLFIRPDVNNATAIHRLHFDAWKKGLKGLYYCRSKNLGKAAKTSDTTVAISIDKKEESGCLSCEG